MPAKEKRFAGIRRCNLSIQTERQAKPNRDEGHQRVTRDMAREDGLVSAGAAFNPSWLDEGALRFGEQSEFRDPFMLLMWEGTGFRSSPRARL
ncbi:MAG: hypothetical protein WCC08_17855, partial [Terrimicrobiaceae bacterium]